MIVAEVVGVKRISLLGKGGVDAPSRNIPVPLKGADGVVRSNSKTILLNEPPRLRPLRWLRDIFLKAQPLLLCHGGEFRFQPQLRQHSNAIQACEIALCQPLSLLSTT